MIAIPTREQPRANPNPSSFLEATPELVPAHLEDSENRFLLLRHGQHLGAIASVARISELLAYVADLRSELGDLALDAFELSAQFNRRSIGRHGVHCAPFRASGNHAIALIRAAGRW
ncbi:MAG: hypothetical protein M3Q30_20110 [Actinomycetota bacterium]|nr:hypothetical protein [Actinomycetota bacterium]